MSASAPLGVLPGMFWDPVKRRYFPIPKEPRVAPPPIRAEPKPRSMRTERDEGSTSYVGNNKRQRISEGGERYRRRRIGYGQQDRGSLSIAEQLAGLEYEGVNSVCSCHSDRFTTLQNFTGGTFLAATAAGKVLMQDPDGTTHMLGICSEPLVGMHFDIARMTVMAIAGGESPHLHYFRRDIDNPDHLDCKTLDLTTLENTDISCVASYDDVCILGSNRSLTSITNYEVPSVTSRKLPSDPLSFDFGTDPHIVYAGMRNSAVLLADLRTPTVMPSTICRVPGGKAVVGVKRLDDGAVPYGLVASAMGNELLIYDTRFGRTPLHTLPDHINTYHAGLDLALSPDSRFLFASGSDRRIGLWSTITGERIHPSLEGVDIKGSYNPLRRTFTSMVQKLSVRDDYGLDVACGGEILHYGKPGLERSERGTGGDETEVDSDVDM